MSFPTPIIEAEQLNSMLNDPQLVLLDCRFNLIEPDQGSKAYLESHLPNAFYLHLDQDLSSELIPGETGRHPLPDKNSLTKLIQRLGITPESHIVCYDASGGAFASRAWWLLSVWANLSQVSVLNGGWQNWVVKGLQTNRQIPIAKHSDFTPEYQDDVWLDAKTVVAKQQELCLLDARTADRFRGENETLDPVAGHIPGAISAPFPDNLDEQGFFLSPEELRDRFQSLQAHQPCVHYCGSGVTACHNYLAMTYADLKPGRLYAGSWSEWITDPTRPVER